MKKLFIILLLSAMCLLLKAQDSNCVFEANTLTCYPLINDFTSWKPDTTKMYFLFWKYKFNSYDSTLVYGDEITILGYNIFQGCATCKPYRTDLSFQPFDYTSLEFIGGEDFAAHIHDHDTTAIDTRRKLISLKGD